MDLNGIFILTDLPSDTADGIITSRIRRCRGCAGCISTNMGTCAIDDEFTAMVPDIFSKEVLVIRTGVSDGQFSMPMRKAAERLGNILQAYTDAGGNEPLESDDVPLREIRVQVRGPGEEGFEDYARELLCMGPVESMEFSYS